MRKNFTEIVFIIDKSGSMYSLTDDTIGGFNGFIDSQKKLDGEARLTTVLFSTYHTKLHDYVDLYRVKPIDRTQYEASGGTAMLDAIGDTIEEVQNRIDNTPEEQRPEHVIFAITTDGQENSSQKFNKEKIMKMINHQKNGHGWEFVFLGANMDAVSEASSIGIDLAATYTADSIGTKSVYTAMDAAVSSYRVMGCVDSAWSNAVDGVTKVAMDNLNDCTLSSAIQ